MDRSAHRQISSPVSRTREPATDPRSPRLRLIHAICLAAILAITSGLNTLRNDFAYDDIAIIKQNPVVIESGHISNIFGQHYWEHRMRRTGETRPDVVYRPLTVLTFRLNFIACGLNPFGYHLVNVLLHAWITALVTIIAARFACSVPGALVAGSLFAVMPIHTEAVANIVGRAELLAALGALLAALFALRIDFNTPAAGLAWSLAAALAGFVAILSKETGAVALAIVPPLAAVSQAGWTTRKRIRTFLITAAICATPAIAYFALRYVATGGQMVLLQMPSRLTNMLVDASPAERFWTVWQLFGLYIAKTFWPRVLCMDYSYKTFALANSLANAHVIIGIISLTILTVASIAWWRRGYRALALAAPALLLAYFPMSNTVFLRILFAERVWYLPSAFLAIILGGLVSAWAVSRRRLDIITIVVLLASIAGLWRTWERNAEWHDNGTLFASAYRDHPNSAQVLACYGHWLVRQGKLRNGLALLDQCVKIAPEMVEAFLTIGQTYAQLGDYRQAIAALQTASMKRPNAPDIQQTLREVSSRLAAAENSRLGQLRQRCETQPASLPLFLEWTNALVDVGRTTEALSLLASKESQFGVKADFQRARAVALMLAGKQDDAIETYRKASTLDAGNVETLVEFATALLDRHRPEDVRQAGDLIDQANRLAPEHPRVLLIRAEWFEMNGQHDQAITLYRQLLRILPPGPLRDTIQARLEVAR